MWVGRSSAQRALEFGHFREQKPTARPEELGLLGVERGPPGAEGICPDEGAEELSPAQGLPWAFSIRPEALKGRAPAFRDAVPERLVSGAPTGPEAINPKPRVNPGLG